MNEITIGDKIYISSKRAAEITGYAKDYVGQLCREGHVDAKMVGRGWYVYEPSIRAHRFGEVAPKMPETSQESEVIEEVAPKATEESLRSWEKPQYKSETFEMIPEMSVHGQELPEQSLTDMQSAWKEWFQQKKEQLDTPELESPEVIDARNDVEESVEDEIEASKSEEEEISVPLHRMEPETIDEVEEDEEAEPIAIHHIEPVMSPRREVYTVEEVPEARVIHERFVSKRPHTKRSYTAVTAALIAFCIITITITVIGTGVADKYLNTLAGKNPAVKFLVGTSEIKR